VTISDLTIDATDAAENAVQIMASNVVFERNDLTNHARPVTFGRLKTCINVGWNSGGYTAVNPIIRQNKIHDCGDPANGNKDHSIYYERVQGGETVDNVMWNVAAWHIHLYPNANGHRVAHNVIDGGGQGGAIFASQNSYTSSNNIVEQNVITNNSRGFEAYWGGPQGSGNIARNNCLFGNSTNFNATTGIALSNNVTLDPQYVSRSARDYRLKAGSPCLAVVGYDTVAKLAAAGTGAPPVATAPPAATNSGAVPAPAKGGKARRHHKHRHSHRHCPKHKRCHTYTHSHTHSHKHHHKHHHATRHHRR
jgi:hypothetical protein